MSCPRCEGVDLWDDNLWLGCNTCGYAWHLEDGGTMIFAKDLPGLPCTVLEVEAVALARRLVAAGLTVERS